MPCLPSDVVGITGGPLSSSVLVLRPNRPVMQGERNTLLVGIMVVLRGGVTKVIVVMVGFNLLDQEVNSPPNPIASGHFTIPRFQIR